MRIYIESTIPSYIVARPARDLLQAARQQITRDWWEFRSEMHELFTSQVVLDEIALGDKLKAKERLELLLPVELLQLTTAAIALTKEILGSGLLPSDADRDSAHIALATVHKMDILLTWNCRHIANAAIQSRLQRLVGEAGFPFPLLCTPEELTGELYD